LVDTKGTPVAFNDYLTFLYWAEPSNYILLSLIYSNVLQTLCREENVKKKGLDAVAKELMHVFSSFVAPIRTHKSIAHDPSLVGASHVDEVVAASAAVTSDATSKVVLEPLPESVLTVLAEHNRHVIDHFVDCTKLVLQGAVGSYAQPADILPMSQVRLSSRHFRQASFLCLLDLIQRKSNFVDRRFS